MFPSMINMPITKGLEETIAFAERRHAILAGNVANMDTPDYQTRDLSVENFQSSLKEYMAAQKTPNPAMQSPGLSPGFNMPEPNAKPLSQQQAVENVRDASSQIVYHDGSDDNMETQITQIAKNQSMHSVAVALLRSQYKSLQMAISGSVNA